MKKRVMTWSEIKAHIVAVSDLELDEVTDEIAEAFGEERDIKIVEDDESPEETRARERMANADPGLSPVNTILSAWRNAR
jgi:hypothetical protein